MLLCFHLLCLLSASHASFSSAPHLDFVSLWVSSRFGAVSDAYLGMNFDRYLVMPRKLLTASFDTIQYNTIIFYCENTLSYNNGVHSQTGLKSGSVKACQLIYRYSTNTKKSKVKKLDMKYSIAKVMTIKS